MKKKTLLLICAMLAICLTGCGKSNNEEENSANDTTKESIVEENVTVDAADPEELLLTVWESYDEADRFPIGGGDYGNMVSDTVGVFDVSRIEDLDSLLGVPSEGAAMIDEAASMMHMMNANTFTAGAYRLKEDATVQVLADVLKENILNRQWMCGFPDTLLIASVGDKYVVSAFGEAQIMENFKSKLQSEFGMTEVIYEENLTE